MDALDEQLAQLKLLNTRPLSPRIAAAAAASSNGGSSGGSSSSYSPGGGSSVSAGGGSAGGDGGHSPKKVGPAVPPKPHKKSTNFPQVPQSSAVKQSCEPLYSKRLQFNPSSASPSPVITPLSQQGRSQLHRKQPMTAGGPHHVYSNIKLTLDNPAILDQQLEALEHHKKQLEKKGLLPNATVPKLTSASFMNGGAPSPTGGGNSSRASPSASLEGAGQPHHVYSNISSNSAIKREPDIVYSNIMHQNNAMHVGKQNAMPLDLIYSNVGFESNEELPPPPPLELTQTGMNYSNPNNMEYLTQTNEDDLPPPPSPVSSSYSELRRATDNFPKMPSYPMPQYGTIVGPSGVVSNNIPNGQGNAGTVAAPSGHGQQTYMNASYHNDYSTYAGPSSQTFSQGSSASDYYGYGSISQGSSTYESIYEPINPRPPSQLSSRSNYSLYTSYVNGPQSSSGSRTPIGGVGSGGMVTTPGQNINENGKHKEAEVEALTNMLVHSMESGGDADSYGICVKCGEGVVGENSGCTAMDQIYHISCFTCSQCQINLQGKPFYSLEGKPYCEEDYLNTLEKCSVCMKPILERILRATGKPYHPQCFTCVVCGNSLDGITFTVDATNQNYCIEDFHKKFAPRCCVCRQPIMPEPGQEETVRVVALDRSFHFECYKCEDCGLLLSSEAEGRGCYPLDDHVLCKSCNAQRVQALTNRMTTEL